MRLALGLASCLVLFACSNRQLVAPDTAAAEFAFAQREKGLRALSSWTLAGKLSIDDSEDGGSGRLNWSVRDAESQMDFRGALGKGAWQLSSRPGFAELRKADGSVIVAGSVRELVESEVGWHIPVDSLRWWALGLPAPGDTRSMDLDEEGRALAMQQQGWNISFERYRQFGDVELPGRLEAVHGRYRVKMAVSKWTVDGPKSADE